MQHDASRLITLLEERLRAFEALASEITAGQQACVSLDLDALRASDSQKERLCAEIRRLDLEVFAFAGSSPLADFLGFEARGTSEAASEVSRRVRELRGYSDAARAEVGRRNLIYTEFLRRARGTVNVMTNVIAHCIGVYAAPTLDGSARVSFDRGY